MPIQYNDDGTLITLTKENVNAWLEKGGQVVSEELPEAVLAEMLQKNHIYNNSEQGQFIEDLYLVQRFGMMHGDHPPNSLSVVDQHLDQNVQGVPDWILLRNDLPVNYPPTAVSKSINYPQFANCTYKVGNWSVFVVWPLKYASQPPKANRLGWLPQMEFAKDAGQLTPKDHLDLSFRYVTYKDDQEVDLHFSSS